MLAGDPEKALRHLSSGCASVNVLEDSRLLFSLQKQRIVELIKAGGAAEQALRLYQELGATALEAYPEAFQEFKELGLALVFQARPYSLNHPSSIIVHNT